MTHGMTARTRTKPIVGPALPMPGLNDAIARSVGSLLTLQHQDGHWVFELEADATIPAEYVLLQHYLGTPEPAPPTFAVPIETSDVPPACERKV